MGMVRWTRSACFLAMREGRTGLALRLMRLDWLRMATGRGQIDWLARSLARRSSTCR